MMIDVRPTRKFTEAFEPVGFGPRIERAGRLVENDNRRASQKRARECDALPLTNTQFRATGKPTSQQCLLFLRQTRNDLFGAGSSDRGFESAASDGSSFRSPYKIFSRTVVL